VIDQDRNKAWGYALFADDIRMEIGGKSSLMGIYQSDIVFPDTTKFPIILPKFVVQIMYFEMADEIKGDLSFKVTFGRDVIVDAPVARPHLSTATDLSNLLPEDPSEDKERIVHIRMPIVISPLPISEMGRLRVRTHYEDGSVLKLGSIAIRQIPEAEFNAATGNVSPR
jgi:hypothetical protein